METILSFTISIVTLLIGIIGHEVMHGVAALAFRDPTPRLAGRITLNPLSHIDTVGSILIPGGLWLLQKLAGVSHPILFGWAKPVPVNIATILQNGGYWGGLVVSSAGILYNFGVAILSILLLLQTDPHSLWAFFLIQLALVNLVLFYFNLLPIPPIDGGRILGYLFRLLGLYRWAQKLDQLERYGIAIIMLIILLPPVSQLLGEVVTGTFYWLLRLFYYL
ncbi:MAG: site-2 protease family protein [Campylobacterales bacterium]